MSDEKTDRKLEALTSKQKADVVRRVFGTPDGKNALRIIELHFGCHLPSGPQCGFDTNQTFYLDGQKAICAEIRQILLGKWGDEPEPNDLTQPIEP